MCGSHRERFGVSLCVVVSRSLWTRVIGRHWTLDRCPHSRKGFTFTCETHTTLILTDTNSTWVKTAVIFSDWLQWERVLMGTDSHDAVAELLTAADSDCFNFSSVASVTPLVCGRQKERWEWAFSRSSISPCLRSVSPAVKGSIQPWFTSTAASPSLSSRTQEQKLNYSSCLITSL